MRRGLRIMVMAAVGCAVLAPASAGAVTVGPVSVTTGPLVPLCVSVHVTSQTLGGQVIDRVCAPSTSLHCTVKGSAGGMRADWVEVRGLGNSPGFRVDYTGPVSTSGACTAPNGDWAATFSGTYAWSCSDVDQCDGGAIISGVLTLTRGTIRRQVAQGWQEEVSDQPGTWAFMSQNDDQLPGIGKIVETPNKSIAYAGGFSVNADWVFALA